MRPYILAPLLMSCSIGITPGFDYTVDIDPAFSSEQEASIILALQQWDRASDGRLHYTSITHGQCVELGQEIGNTPGDNQVCYIAKSAQWIKDNDPFSSDPLAYTQLWPMSNHANVFLPIEELSSDKFALISLHESGHSLGLKHSQSDTLMCWDVGCMSATITCDDIAQFDDIRGVSDKSKTCPNGGTYTLSGKP